MTTRGTYDIIDFAVRDTRETEHSNVRVAQLDRASGYGPEGREFEFFFAHVEFKGISEKDNAFFFYDKKLPFSKIKVDKTYLITV